MQLRARPFVSILIALLVLLVLSGVVYALGRSLGYIPGYGVVDQNVPMLILAEPVSQTRDGITITINEIMLTSDTMFSTITTENIPSNLMLPMSDTTTVTCKGDSVYQLPDGSQLHFGKGGNGSIDPFDNGNLTKLSYRGRGYAKFAVPININEITDITLHIPCVTGDIPAGSLPENWEFHLKFIPAPADMLNEIALPVIEYTPSPIPTSVTGTPHVNPILIRKVIDLGDQYVLMGEFVPPPGTVLSDTCCNFYLLDRNGYAVEQDEMPGGIDFLTATSNARFPFTWWASFKKEGLTLPVTIKIEDLHWKSISMPFEFDVGNNPQPGDEYQINQPFEADGLTVLLERIRVINPQLPSAEGGYAFFFTWPANDSRRISIRDISMEGYPPSINSGFSGGGWSGQEPSVRDGINFSVEFTPMPKGKLTANFTFNVVDEEQVWILNWQP